MDEAQRTKLLEGLRILNAQFDASVDKVRTDLAAGWSVEDAMAGGIVEFEKAGAGYLASVVMARLIKEARKPAPKPRKKTAVVAKLPRKEEIADALVE